MTLIPPRVLMRAVVQKSPTTSPLKASLTAVDALFAEFGPFGPNRKVPSWTIPASVFLAAPPDTTALPLPFLYGEKSDEGARDPVTNKPSSKGLIPLWFAGYTKLDNAGLPLTSAFDASLPVPTITAVDDLTGAGTIPNIPIYFYAVGMKNGRLSDVSALAQAQGHAPGTYGDHALRVRVTDPGGLDAVIVVMFDNPTFHPYDNPDQSGGAVVQTKTLGAHNVSPDVANGGTFDYQYIWKSLTDGSRWAGATAGPTSEWGELVGFGHAIYSFISVYGSNGSGGDGSVTPDRVKIDLAARAGSDILIPNYINDAGVKVAGPNWPYPTPYVDAVGQDGETYRLSGILVRKDSQLLKDHLAGTVNITCNAIGVEDVGDGSGLPIDQVEDVKQHCLENFLIGQYKSGRWCTEANAPRWEDGTPKVRSSSFAAYRDFQIKKLGGRGLVVSWYQGEAIDVRELFAMWNRESEGRIGINGHGQVIEGFLNDTADATTFPAIDHVTQIFGPVTRTPGEERENTVSGQCDWDPDKDTFRQGLVTVSDFNGYRKNKNRWTKSDPILAKMLFREADLRWVLTRRLARLAFGVAAVDITGPVGYLDVDVNAGVRVTTIEGTGAAGWVDRPLWLLRRKFDVKTRLTVYSLLDLGGSSGSGLLPDPATRFILTAVPATGLHDVSPTYQVRA